MAEKQCNLLKNGGGTKDSGTIQLNNSYTLYYRKIDKIVVVWCAINNSGGGTVTIGTLPEGFRPNIEVSQLDSIQGYNRVSVVANGTVKVAPVSSQGGTGNYCYCSLTYCVD